MDNIVLCGFMGAGKTVVGKELARLINYNFIDMDELIEQEQGVTINEIFKIYGEAYFRDLEHEMCKKIANMQKCIVSTGGGAMTYQRNVEAIKKRSKVFFLDSSYSVICERLESDATRPLFQDKAKAKKLYDQRKEKYLEAADYVIDGDMSITQTALAIVDTLKKGGKNEKNKSQNQ